jgi:hypothetical protein
MDARFSSSARCGCSPRFCRLWLGLSKGCRMRCLRHGRSSVRGARKKSIARFAGLGRSLGCKRSGCKKRKRPAQLKPDALNLTNGELTNGQDHRKPKAEPFAGAPLPHDLCARLAASVLSLAARMKPRLEIHAARMRCERTEQRRVELWRRYKRDELTLDEVQKAQAGFWANLAEDARIARRRG